MVGKTFYRKLPEIVKSILIISDGWLVGSSIPQLMENVIPKDYDIVVPYDNWNKAILMLKEYPFKLNTFGGFKFTLNEIEMDIWPQNPDEFFKYNIGKGYYFNLKHQIMLKDLN